MKKFRTIYLLSLVSLVSTTTNDDLHLFSYNKNNEKVKIMKKTVKQVVKNSNNIILEKSEKILREFYLKNLNLLEDRIYFLRIRYDNLILDPDIAINNQIVLLKANETLKFSILYNCLNQSSKGWSNIILEFFSIENHISFEFVFTKHCLIDVEKSYQKSSLSFLILLSFFVVGFGSTYNFSKIKKTSHFFSSRSEKKFKRWQRFKNRINSLKIQKENIRKQKNNFIKIFFLVLACSLVLLLIKFFKKNTIILLTFCSSGSAILILFSIYKETMGGSPQFNFHITNKKDIFSMVFAIITVFYYLQTKNWVLNNLIAISFLFIVYRVFRLKNLKDCSILLMSVFFYDVFWVFFSKYFFQGKSLMNNAMNQVDLPFKLEVPIFTHYPSHLSYAIIGLGDLCLPGVIISFLYNFEKRKIKQIAKLNKFSIKYYWAALIGYFFGLILSFQSLFIFKTGQPAMLYIVPSILSLVYLCSYYQGQFLILWKGI